MPNEDFIYNYFVRPIISKTGYNPINTTAYALFAIAALYVIWNIFRSKKITVDKNFVYAIIPFVLFGSTMRVVTDAIDNKVFTAVTPIHKVIIDSHLYDYGYFTITPGIYLVTAGILFLCMGLLHMLKKPQYLAHSGVALWLFHFMLLLPFMKFMLNLIPVLVLAVIPTVIVWCYLKNEIYTLVVAGHALDGAATFYVIDIFGPTTGKIYFEQHVVGSFIGDMFHTYFAFYLVKVIISGSVAYLLQKEKNEAENFKNFVALAIMIMGFAPGIRDILRMVVGT